MTELLTPAEMATADRLTIDSGVPGAELMERAGRAVADALCGLSDGRRVAIVAGPGNNGGDGFVAARLLAERGRNVTVHFVGDRERLGGDAALASRRWSGSVQKAAPEAFGGCDSIVDALFGAGLDREITGEAAAIVAAINAAAKLVVAVDLPSGVNGDTGAIMGAAVQATRTVTFFRRKPGHLLLPGRRLCGVTSVADIGIPDGVLTTIKPKCFANDPAIWGAAFPWPRAEGHKYSRGHVVVVSGGLSTTGAARLAARGALRAGSGLVTIASPRDALLVNAAANLAVMVRPVDGPVELTEFLADRRRNAVAIGPGGGVGSTMREQVRAVLASGAAAVLDADALTSFADIHGADTLTSVADDEAALAEAIRANSGRSVVLTPHDGEYHRLFSKLWPHPNAFSKLEKARLAAGQSGAVLVLKGADSVVAAPDGRATIAANAPPTLATAGAGDVLTGMITGLLAQGMAAFEAASAAVWLHGEAAHAFGPGLIAEDLPDLLPGVYRRLAALIGGPIERPIAE